MEPTRYTAVPTVWIVGSGRCHDPGAERCRRYARLYPRTARRTSPHTDSARDLQMPPDNNELRIDYQASTDKDTVINLTSHSHFNLSWHGLSVENQMLLVNADCYVPMRGPDKIPTGELRPSRACRSTSGI